MLGDPVLWRKTLGTSDGVGALAQPGKPGCVLALVPATHCAVVAMRRWSKTDVRCARPVTAIVSGGATGHPEVRDLVVHVAGRGQRLIRVQVFRFVCVLT